MTARLVMAAWLGAWVVGLFFLANQLVHWAVQLWGIRWGFTGLALIIIALLIVMLALRLCWPVLGLIFGWESPRLARRDFRDSIANAVFFIKTGGLWKEPF